MSVVDSCQRPEVARPARCWVVVKPATRTAEYALTGRPEPEDRDERRLSGGERG